MTVPCCCEEHGRSCCLFHGPDTFDVKSTEQELRQSINELVEEKVALNTENAELREENERKENDVEQFREWLAKNVSERRLWHLKWEGRTLLGDTSFGAWAEAEHVKQMFDAYCPKHETTSRATLGFEP